MNKCSLLHTYKMKLTEDVIYEICGIVVSHSVGDHKIEDFNPPDENAEAWIFISKNALPLVAKKGSTLNFDDGESSIKTKKMVKYILDRFKDLLFFPDEFIDCDGKVRMREYSSE